MSIKSLLFILGLLLALVWLSWYNPGYVNCEGYKMKSISEVPSRCVTY